MPDSSTGSPAPWGSQTGSLVRDPSSGCTRITLSHCGPWAANRWSPPATPTRIFAEGEPSPGSSISALTARAAVELAKLRGMSGQTLLVGDLRLAGLLLQVPDSVSLLSYCEDVVAPFRRHDASRDTTVVQTLSALVRNDLDARRRRAVVRSHEHYCPTATDHRGAARLRTDKRGGPDTRRDRAPA